MSNTALNFDSWESLTLPSFDDFNALPSQKVPAQKPSLVESRVPVSSHITSESKQQESAPTALSAPPKTIEELDVEFYCVVDSINLEAETLEATVYNKLTNEQEMALSLEYHDFIKSDRSLITVNTIFYWRMGTKHTSTFSEKKKRFVTQSSNFSEFRVKRSFVKKESVKSRIENEMKMLNFVLG